MSSRDHHPSVDWIVPHHVAADQGTLHSAETRRGCEGRLLRTANDVLLVVLGLAVWFEESPVASAERAISWLGAVARVAVTWAASA